MPDRRPLFPGGTSDGTSVSFSLEDLRAIERAAAGAIVESIDGQILGHAHVLPQTTPATPVSWASARYVDAETGQTRSPERLPSTRSLMQAIERAVAAYDGQPGPDGDRCDCAQCCGARRESVRRDVVAVVPATMEYRAMDQTLVVFADDGQRVEVLDTPQNRYAVTAAGGSRAVVLIEERAVATTGRRAIVARLARRGLVAADATVIAGVFVSSSGRAEAQAPPAGQERSFEACAGRHPGLAAALEQVFEFEAREYRVTGALYADGRWTVQTKDLATGLGRDFPAEDVVAAFRDVDQDRRPNPSRRQTTRQRRRTR